MGGLGGYDLVHYDDLAYVASAHQECEFWTILKHFLTFWNILKHFWNIFKTFWNIFETF
jgi:hypothetical protein